MPLWLVALLVFLPVWAVEHFSLLRMIPWYRDGEREFWTMAVLFGAALFVPGAVRRAKAGQIVVLLAMGGGLSVATVWTQRLPVVAEYWVLEVALLGVPFLALGLAELVLGGRFSPRGIPWVLAGALAAAALVDLITLWTWFEGWRFSMPNRYGMGNYPVSGEIGRPLTVLLAWSLIPLCIRASVAVQARWRYALAVMLLVACAGTAAFREVLSHPLARRSMLQDGPFTREASVWWLLVHGVPQDKDLIWRALEEHPWTYSRYCHRDEERFALWRVTAAYGLAETDAPGTAERLSRLLRATPNRYIAEDLAELFAREHRYETVPLLMRYALAEDSWVCTEAMEKMALPRAAMAVLRHEAVWQARLDGLARITRVDEDTRARLARLLGQDVGSGFDDWAALYDSVTVNGPTPLPDAVGDETDRVIAAMLRYFSGASELAGAGLGEAKRMGLTGEAAMAHARTIMRSVPVPDWNVLTTDELEAEIDACAARVTKAIGRHSPPIPVSQPAESPEE